MMNKCLCFLLIMLLKGNYGSVVERELYQKLFDNYYKLERPVANTTDAILINIGLSLKLIISLDVKNYAFVTSVWINMKWHDYNLQWNPIEYNNISMLVVPEHIIWKPDIIVYNSIEGVSNIQALDAQLAYDGEIQWCPHGILRTNCKLVMTYFPFDQQTCDIEIASWTTSRPILDISSAGIDLSLFDQSDEWKLETSDNVTYVDRQYEVFPDEEYPKLRFIFWLKRRSLYYYVNIIMPSCLIVMISLAGFILPPDGGEKAALQISLMLATALFLQVLQGITPVTSETVPLLGIFFSICLILVSLSAILTIFIQRIHYNSSMEPVPKFLRTVFLKVFPRLFCIKTVVHAKRPENNLKSFNKITEDENEEAEESEQKEHTYILKFSQWKRLLTSLDQINDQVKIVANRINTENEDETIRNEWKLLAFVVDRLCLFTLTLAFTCTLIVIICYAPYLYA